MSNSNSSFTVFEKLDWNKASKLARKSPGARIAKKFLDAADEASKRLGDQAYVYHASYPYGTDIVGDEGFLLPSSDSAGNNLTGITHRLPVSLVLSNQVEVYLPGARWKSQQKGWPDGIYADRPTTLRLLRPGELFGTFEVVDRFLGKPSQSTLSAWKVSAGARSAQLVYSLKAKPVREVLTNLLGHHFELEKRGPFTEWPWHVMEALSLNCQWRVETLVFPEQWENDALQWSWWTEVFRVAWFQMQDDNVNEIRREQIDSSLNEGLQGLSRNVDDWDLLAAFLRCIDAATSERLPVFVPFSMSSPGTEGGPFCEIIQAFTEQLGESQLSRNTSGDTPSRPTVLVPGYLGEGEEGLLSFEFTPWLRDSKSTGTTTSKEAKNIAQHLHLFHPLLKELIPNVDWERLCVVLRSNATPTTSCIRAQDLEKRFNLFATSESSDTADNDPIDGDDEQSNRADTSHGFFSPSVIVRRT